MKELYVFDCPVCKAAVMVTLHAPHELDQLLCPVCTCAVKYGRGMARSLIPEAAGR
jgi:transcription elongation factor Elf1